MRNFIILSLLLLGFTFAACTRKDAPEAVKKTFAQKFTDAKSVKWDSEEADEWEAEFKMNGKEMTASFDSTGKWLETETEISVKDLPAAVTNTLNKEFAGFKTDEISVIENPEMKGFELALKNKENEMNVIFSGDGTVLIKEAAGEEAEEGSEEKTENETTEAGEEKEMEAPAIITKAFADKYAGATEVEWGSESANEWEAEFTMNGNKMSACFDSTAKWINTETVISEKDLPAAVTTTLNTKFKDYEKGLIETFESPEMMSYELRLKKGETSVEVIIGKDGKILENSGVKEEDESSKKEEKSENK